MREETMTRTPAVCDIVLTFVDPDTNNLSDIAPAVVVRAFPGGYVNLRVLHDGEAVTRKCSVSVFDDEASARATTARQTGSDLPFAAFWPPQG